MNEVLYECPECGDHTMEYTTPATFVSSGHFEEDDDGNWHYYEAERNHRDEENPPSVTCCGCGAVFPFTGFA